MPFEACHTDVMQDIEYIDSPITKEQVKEIALQRFGDMVKVVVDIEKEVMAIGAELHADEEAFLLDKGSKQENLWGINIYPDLLMPDALEYDSMINIRPSQNNGSRSVEGEAIRKTISEIVRTLVPDLQ